MKISCSSKIIRIDEFGAAVLELTPQEFAEKGFEFGDTIDLSFSNGAVLENVPYYNGFYIPIGEPVVVAYPSYQHPACNYNCLSFQEQTGVSEGDSVVITMHEKGAKADVMALRGVVYSNDPKDYTDRDRFANAREFHAGRIGKGKLYRCASPFDHMMNRPEAVSEFLEKNGVQTTFSLSETEKSLRERYADMPPYVRKLYENGNVLPIGLGAGYFTDKFRTKLTAGFIRAMDKPFPWAIHCLEGKDRTGFVCILLGALMGGSYRELTDDYMTTYDNYYNITEKSDPFRYNGFKTTFADTYLRIFAGLDENEAPEGHDYTAGAENYLRQGGMCPEEIEKLKRILE